MYDNDKSILLNLKDFQDTFYPVIDRIKKIRIFSGNNLPEIYINSFFIFTYGVSFVLFQDSWNSCLS